MKIYLTKVHKKFKLLLIFITASISLFSAAASAEIKLGNSNAPVTIIEYGSLTCDYCIHFHRKVLPQIKLHYIDTEKVSFIYRHFPTSEAATHGAVAAQCAGSQYYAMLDRLYATVGNWFQADDIKTALTQQAVSIGLDAKPFRACLNNTQHLNDIINQQRQATIEHNVRGTPTFLINGKSIRGKKSFNDMMELIEKELLTLRKQNRVEEAIVEKPNVP